MTFITRILQVLFPTRCLVCKQQLAENSLHLLCEACGSNLEAPRSFACPVCRGRIPEHFSGGIPPLRSLCHPKCPYIVRALSWYSNPVVRGLVRRLKFRHESTIAIEFGLRLAESLKAAGVFIDLVVPIPLPRTRSWSRGYNQAALIAQALSERCGFRCDESILLRAHSTAAQTTQSSWKERRINMQGAFIVSTASAVQGKTILLVDDVWTSGATLSAASETLKGVGARRIIAAVAARAH